MVCSKFDKLDKIVISLTFIVVTMFSIFNCFCFASSEVPINIIRNLQYDGNSETFIDSTNGSVGYYSLTVGHKYRITNSGQYGKFLRYTSEIPSDGVGVLGGFNVSSDSYYEFTAVESKIFVSDSSLSLTTNFQDLSLVDLTVGYDAVITDLFYNVGISQLWSVFNTSVPYVLIIVVVAFGIYLITRMIKGLSKGKGRV